MFVNEDMNVLFEFLVNTFSLTIGLRVIGCGCGYLDTQEVIQFTHELSSELWPVIRAYGCWKAMELPHMLKVQSCRTQGCDCGVSGDEVIMFGN
jgi:hypothetical protein